jgi:predicted dehydrogenase
MMRIGMIGSSEGNGHPFSFSAIINGFSEVGMANSGWPVIYNYLRQHDASEFGFGDCRVTHAWTQDPEVTQRLCAACLITHAVLSPEAMIGKVDALILARDDYENHLRITLPFLKAGIPVFIDKPLSLDPAELKIFQPHLDDGKLMSCSGMRYASELDEPRATLSEYGVIRLVRGAILNSWEKYGIHIVDAVLNTISSRPVSVISLPAAHASLAISMNDGSIFQVDALGDTVMCFRIDLFGTRKISSHVITDNFSMFRRMLFHFIRSVESGKPAIDPRLTVNTMRLLIAGRRALAEHKEVSLNEIVL